MVELHHATSTVERFCRRQECSGACAEPPTRRFSTLTEHMPASHQAHRQYGGNDRLEAATTPAVTLGAMRYRNVVSILKSGLDRAPTARTGAHAAEPTLPGEYEPPRRRLLPLIATDPTHHRRKPMLTHNSLEHCAHYAWKAWRVQLRRTAHLAAIAAVISRERLHT